MSNNQFTIDCPNCSAKLSAKISSVSAGNCWLSYSGIKQSYHVMTGGGADGVAWSSGVVYGGGGGGAGASGGQPALSKEATLQQIKDMIKGHKDKIQGLKRAFEVVKNTEYPKDSK